MESEDQKRKPYCAPVLTKLTLEQAKKYVGDRKNCSAEEAAQFLKPLRQTSDDRLHRSKLETLSMKLQRSAAEHPSAPKIMTRNRSVTLFVHPYFCAVSKSRTR